MTQVPWWRTKAWWIDHWADVIGAIMIPLILAMIECNGRRADELRKKYDELQVQQQIEIQRQSKNESAAEADNHQAISLLEDMGTRIGDAQLSQRRAIAQSVLEYSAQGRLYHPSTSVVIDYLGRECDQTTHDLLRQAADTAVIQTPKNAVVPTCGEKSLDGESMDSCLKRKADALASVNSDNNSDKGKLVQAELDRQKVCGANHVPPPVETSPAATQQVAGAGSRVFRQYVDVGCGETNASILQIPLSENDRKTLHVAGPLSSHFEGVSNLSSFSISQPEVADDVLKVAYSITGLDRQFLGNCPGGGHATVVLEYQLAPRGASEPPR